MLLPVVALAVALAPASAGPAASPTQDPAAPTAQAAPAPATGAELDAGLAAFKKRRFSLARSHFQKAYDADPGSPAANFYLGYTIYKITEPKRPFHPDKQQAAQLFAKAYELDPKFKPAWAPRK